MNAVPQGQAIAHKRRKEVKCCCTLLITSIVRLASQ
jgi:hypothetical protein